VIEARTATRVEAQIAAPKRATHLEVCWRALDPRSARVHALHGHLESV